MIKGRYKKIINSFQAKKIIVFGDLMLDRYMLGEVDRVSPEAPVPVVLAREEILTPGGAGNVAVNIAALGGDAFAIGLVGDDESAEKLIKDLKSKGINIEGVIITPDRPTTQKIRVIVGSQQITRIDKENAEEISSPVKKKLTDFLSRHIKNTDAVIISDYAKGIITKDLVQKIILYSKRYKKPLVCDPKPRNALFFKGVTLITPNQKEAFAIAGINKIKEAGLFIKKRTVANVLITQGAEGMTLFSGKKIKHFPAKAREVFEITGAGDTVVATIALSLASGGRLEEAVDIANHAAGIVVGKKRTATVSIRELRKNFKNLY